MGAGGLQRLRQEGCGRCLMPATHGGAPVAVVINTAGGLTGGDRFAVEAQLASGARLTVSTQAAERIYRSAGGLARITNKLRLAAGAQLDWLPQETILFDRAGLERSLCVEMAEDARFLGLEMLVLGRKAMREDIIHAHVADNWRIRRGGRLVHAEAFRLREEAGALLRHAALLDGNRALATLVLADSGAETALEAARAALPDDGEVRAAASAMPGRLIVRWLAPDLMPLKKALKRFLAEVFSMDAPHVWQT